MANDDDKQEPGEGEAPAPSFWAFLREQRHGALHADLGEKMAEVVKAVLEHKKNGSMSLVLKVSPTKDGVSVFVTDEIKANVPEADRGGSIMYATEQGQLQRKDPRQMEMPIAQIVRDTEVVNVNTETGEVVSLAGGDA